MITNPIQDGAAGTAAGTIQTKPDVRRFALSQIRVRVGDNAREDFDPDEMRKLVESMRQSREKIGSTLQPLLGVLKDDGTVELIAGERRFRAAPEAGYEELEVKVVREPKLRDILIWNLTENTVRANLKPTEKAKRVVELLAMTEDSQPVFSRHSLAEELGEDRNVIDHCVNLMKAPDKVRAEIDRGVPIEIGGMIGSLPPEQQEETAKAVLFGPMGPLPRDAARDYIAEHCRRDLRKAQWSREDPDLVSAAGACTQCPQWGGNHVSIEGKNRVHVCLNPRCYEEKTRAFQLKVEQRAEDEKTKVLHDAGKYFLPNNNEVKPDCGYVDLNDKPDAYLLEGGRTAGTPKWEKILADSDVPQVIAFDHQGRARNLVESALAITAAKLSPHANLFKTSAGDNVKTNDEKKLEGRIAKAQKAATAIVLRDACIDLMEGIRSAWNWRMLFELWWSIITTGGHQREDGELLLSVLDPNAKPEGDLWQQLAELVRDKLKSDEQLGAFVVLSRNIRGIRYNGLSHIEHSMTEVCDLAEFKAGKWRKTLETELKSAESGVKAAAKKEAKVKGKKEQETHADIKDALAFSDALLTLHVREMEPNENGVFEKPVSISKRFSKGVFFAVEFAGHRLGLALGSRYATGNASGGGLPNVRGITTDRKAALKDEITSLRKRTGSAEWNVPKATKADHMKMYHFLCEVEKHLGGTGKEESEPQTGLRASKDKTVTGDPEEFFGESATKQKTKSKGKLSKKPHGGVPPVDPKVKAQARKLYDKGMGKGAIAKELGISPNTVGNWQKRDWPKRKAKK